MRSMLLVNMSDFVQKYTITNLFPFNLVLSRCLKTANVKVTVFKSVGNLLSSVVSVYKVQKSIINSWILKGSFLGIVITLARMVSKCPNFSQACMVEVWSYFTALFIIPDCIACLSSKIIFSLVCPKISWFTNLRLTLHHETVVWHCCWLLRLR